MPTRARGNQVLCPIVVGRSDELAIIQSALERAADSHGAVLLIAGEAGIGKTRLTREAEDRARGLQMRCLRGRAVRTGASISFRPLSEAINAAVRSSGPPDDPAVAPYRGVLRSFVPEWAGEPVAAEGENVVLVEGILRLLRAFAREAPVLLVLEDLHWADADTLAVVEYLADNLADEPLLCLATLRTDETSPAPAVAASLAARRAATTIELARLSHAEVEALARAALASNPPAPLLRVVTERADGIPFLIEELLTAYVATGGPTASGERWWGESQRAAVKLPASFRDLVRARLDVLTDDARAVTTAAAMLGTSFDHALIAAVTGLSDTQVLDGLRAAAAAHLITISFEAGFRFRHALIPETIVAELLPPERAALARTAAEAIERAFAGLPGEWCERAAGLREDAGDHAIAATHLMEAGARALKNGALATAEEILERARDLTGDDRWHRMGVDRLLIEALARAGKTARIEQIATALTEWYDEHRQTMESMGVTSMYLPAARAMVAAAKYERAREYLEATRRAAVRLEAQEVLVRVRMLEAEILLAERDPARAHDAAADVLASAEVMGLADLTCDSLLVLGIAATRMGAPDQAMAAFERVRATAERTGRIVEQIRALLELGTLHLLDPADEHLARARALAGASGAVSLGARADLLLAWRSMLRFELDDAREALGHVIEDSARYRLTVAAAAHEARAVTCALVADRTGVEAALEAADRRSAGADLARALLALADEDRTEARAAFGRIEPGTDDLPAPVATIAATLASLLHQPKEVRSAAADEVFEHFPWFRHLARRLAAETALAEGWGEPVEWLRGAGAFFEAAGVERVAAACRASLRGAGARVPRRGRGTSVVPEELRVRGITTREMDVFGLLGEGLSNHRIAERLFLSPRTVETHVASISRKLQITTRAELIALAARITHGA